MKLSQKRSHTQSESKYQQLQQIEISTTTEKSESLQTHRHWKTPYWITTEWRQKEIKYFLKINENEYTKYSN